MFVAQSKLCLRKLLLCELFCRVSEYLNIYNWYWKWKFCYYAWSFSNDKRSQFSIKNSTAKLIFTCLKVLLKKKGHDRAQVWTEVGHSLRPSLEHLENISAPIWMGSRHVFDPLAKLGLWIQIPHWWLHIKGASLFIYHSCNIKQSLFSTLSWH